MDLNSYLTKDKFCSIGLITLRLYSISHLTYDDTVLDNIPSWPPATHLDDPPTMQEVNKAVYQLASDKAPGADCIPAEVFKEGGIKL